LPLRKATARLDIVRYITNGGQRKPAVNNAMSSGKNNTSTDGVLHGEDSSTIVAETTTFHEDEDVVVKEFPRYISIGESLKNAALSAREMDIKNFLGRPIVCATGNYTTTSVVGSQLQSIPLPTACLTNATYADKLRGFYGFRAKMVCRLQVNAQRFQQGRLLLHYLPQTATMQPNRLQCALMNLVMITQQPRVDFEIGKDTEVRLEIPYVSNTMYYDLMTGLYDFGTFYLTVYSALRAGDGSLSCPYTVWCHFEDVEFQYPAVSQSGIKTLRARGKGSGKVDYSGQELRNEGLGPISSILTKAASSASILSEIPLISAFTGPASWALGVMGRAADALGYSKPTSAGPSEKRLLTTFYGMNQSNVVDNSTKFAIRSDNAVSHLPGFAGTDIDEMSIPYLVSIPSWFSTTTWSTASTQGTSILTFPLGIQGFSVLNNITTGGTTYPAYSCPVIQYIGNIFSLWRGSITVTFKIVKTEFHSGRLMVVFFPGKNNQGNVRNTFANSQYVYREVIDLRTSTEVSITFPWTSLTPYLGLSDVFGSVVLYVLNPLVATPNVAQSVDILAEVSGAPDFEFAAPQNAKLTPVIFTPQSGISATAKPVVSVMDNQAISPVLEPSMYCIGERVQSVRQLIKRFSTWFVVQSATQPTMQISPQVNYMPSIGTTQGYYNVPGQRIDLTSYFAVAFRFWRGSTRIKIIDPSSDALLTTQTLYNTGGAGFNVIQLISTPAVPNTDQPTVTVPSLSGGGEYEMPYYSMTHASHVVVSSSPSFFPAREAIDNQPYFQVTQQGNFSTNTRVYRAAGDDFSLGFFFGTVPLTPSNV